MEVTCPFCHVSFQPSEVSSQEEDDLLDHQETSDVNQEDHDVLEDLDSKDTTSDGW